MDVSKAVFNTDGTRPVGSHLEGASPFGVMDMAGNVWEWVNDWYVNKYNDRELSNPKGSDSGKYKVLRGGSWDYDYSDYLRGAYRSNGHPEVRNYSIGFRVAEDF